ncbi:MAG: imidazole glycerol phosphate synthase subunit HisH [Bacteroidetes bacterium]|nr:imidazole glycerol phosphate synthase subunit HisH [Bacteroidota bacterium]
MKVVIIEYNAGNICSVDIALQKIGINAILSDNAMEIRSADKVIFPGVGAAATAMQYLIERNLDRVIKELNQPLLGICLGMQLLCAFSEEGQTGCMGVFPQTVKQFKGAMKIPQMGWNNVSDLKTSIFNGVSENEYMYFVHSYYVAINENTIASTDYGGKYSAALQKDNFYAVQFHPEKSAKAGQKILENFIAL